MDVAYSTISHKQTQSNRVCCLFPLALINRLNLTESAVSTILHKQTQSNRVCYFQTLNAIFPKDTFQIIWINFIS